MYKSPSFSKLSIISDLMHPSLLSSCSKSFRKFIYLTRIYNTVMEWSWEIFHWCVLSFIKDVTLAKMVALHCYVLHGADASQTDMEETVKALIPNNSISKENGKEYWVNMAESYFDKVSHFTIYFMRHELRFRACSHLYENAHYYFCLLLKLSWKLGKFLSPRR